jgi:hypothetical protein
MGFLNRFRRGSATNAIPRSNATRLNGSAIALNTNLRNYVNAYTNARNNNSKKNSIPPMNAKIVNSLKRYINSKRPKAAGAAAAAVNNAGGSNANAAAAAAGVAGSSSSSPNTLAIAAAKPLLALEAPPAQVAAAAAGAAKQQALALGMGSNKANNVAANAAANAANAANPKASPQQAANAAAAGAAAAGLNANAQENAAEAAAENATPRSIKILKSYLANHTNNRAPNGQIRMLNKYRANANASGQLNANLRSKVNARLSHLRGLGAAAAAQRPNTGIRANETSGAAPMEMNINVPGSNIKVKVKRNNVGSNWYFANSANNAKYNLNNRNQNKPRVRNVGSGNLFKQGN